MAATKLSRAGNKPKGSAPINAHPAFPLVLALWFAALLGLGSLILPMTMIERLVTASGIAELIPAAAPPLGFTARSAVAIGGALLGAVLGLFAARKIAPSAPETARRRSITADENARRQPIRAHEDLGSESFDSVADFGTARRRVLTPKEESRASDFLVVAPLPGEGNEDGFAFAQNTADETLELGELAEFTEEQELAQHNAASEGEGANSHVKVFSTIAVEPTIGDPLPFSPPSMAHRAASALQPQEIETATFEEEDLEQPTAPPQTFAPAEPLADAPETADPAEEPSTEQEAELGLVQLVQKLGATLKKHREWSVQRADQQQDGPRFPRAVVLPEFAETDFEASDPAEAVQAMAAFFSEPEQDQETVETILEQAERQEFVPAAPAAADAGQQLRPFAGLSRIDDTDDEEDLDNIAASFRLPLARTAEPEPETAKPEPAFAAPAQDDVAAEEEEAYGSLRVMKNPFRDHRPEFVRIEEPEREIMAPQPAVVFPNEVPSAARMFDRPADAIVAEAPAAMAAPARTAGSNDDNDRLLREALMNLQRIGKN